MKKDTIKIQGKKVKMVAHRGMSGLERENTQVAFVAAGNRSHFGIETDIHKTIDGKYVTFHDNTTKRVTNEAVDIEIEKATYKELSEIILPDLDGSTVRQDIRIPLLQEYIHICKKYEKTCVLEIKGLFAEDDIAEVIDIIRQMEYLDHVIFIAFDVENCIAVRKLLPEQPVQWLLYEEITEREKAILYQYHFDLDAYYKRLSKELVDELHAHGLVVNCWTCDNVDEAKELIDMGVDFITSNILE